jgi:hypothetical protein
MIDQIGLLVTGVSRSSQLKGALKLSLQMLAPLRQGGLFRWEMKSEDSVVWAPRHFMLSSSQRQFTTFSTKSSGR